MTDSAAHPASPAKDEFDWSPINQAILVAAMTIAALLGIFSIRMLALRVTQYHETVFETYARRALADEDFGRVVDICNGALAAGVNTSSHHGTVFLLRAQAHQGMGDLDAAVADLDRLARFAQESHYFLEEDERAESAIAATRIGEALLTDGRAEEALRAFSTAAVGSGDPVSYLHRLADNLPAAQQNALWGTAEPYVTLRDFGGDEQDRLERVVEEQGREIAALEAATDASHIALSPATADGRSAYGADVYVPLENKAFALRVVARGEGGPMPDVLLAYWFDAARVSDATQDSGWRDAGEGWKACEIERDFYAERQRKAEENDYGIAGGYVSKVAFELARDSAPQLWLDRIEVYIQR